MCAYIAGQSANFFLLSLSLPHFYPFYLSFLFPLPSLPSPFSSPWLLSLSHLSFCCSPVGCWLPSSYLLLFCCEHVMDACCALKCVPRLNPQPATGGACFPFRLKTMMARFSKGVSEVTSYVNLMPTRSFQLSSIASGSWGHLDCVSSGSKICQASSPCSLSSGVEAEGVLHRPFSVPMIPEEYQLDLTTQADLK